MSYCVNPACTQPKNPKNATVCQSCGNSLLLHNRYRILGILGNGGFGATFAASDQSHPDGLICVVKQLKPDTQDPNVFKMAKQLFEREAQTLGIVGNHPQIPRLLNFFESSQHFYLVQEYVKGLNLHQEVRKNGPFSEAGVQLFLSELLPIMQYIHGQKVIHRDIKPANLIRRQTDSKLVLIDFGAVKTQVNTMMAANSSENTTLTNFVVGTEGFAPPEQLAQRPIYASDIFAIGVTCLFLLTGKTPREIGSDSSTGELNWRKLVSVSDNFAYVLQKMMELSIKPRYKSAQEVLDALALAPYEEGMRQGLLTNLRQGNPFTQTPTPLLTQASTPIPTRIQSPNPPLASPDTTLQAGIHNSGYVSSRQSNNGDLSPLTGGKAGIIRGQGSPKSSPNRVQNRDEAFNRTQKTFSPQETTKYTAEGLVSAYKQGHRDFVQLELMGLNLLKAVLPRINCYKSKLTQSIFQEADLTSANLGRANLSFANFKNANLYEAYLYYADLASADLRGADLTGANLRFANLRGANFCGANLTNALVTKAQLALAKTNWLTVMPSGKRGFW